MFVWTLAHRPFIMGGNCNGPIGIEVAVGEQIPLGKGYFGYVVVSPKTGKTYVAEVETGAFVGNSVAAVRDDIASAADNVMQQQMVDARELRETADKVDADYFWRLLER
jgi:hypothetical protein